jgi:hypothetical protein
MVVAACAALLQPPKPSESKLQQLLAILLARKQSKQRAWLTQLRVMSEAGLLTPQVPKSTEFYLQLTEEYNEGRFRNTLRVSRKTFAWLLQRLYDDEVVAETGRPRLEARRRMCVGLYRMAHKCHVKAIAATFGICEGSVVNFSYEFMALVTTKLANFITYACRTACPVADLPVPLLPLQLSCHSRGAAAGRGCLRAEVRLSRRCWRHGRHSHRDPPAQRAAAAGLLLSQTQIRRHHARRR